MEQKYTISNDNLMQLRYIVTINDSNEAINTILKNKLQISTRLLSKLIRNKCIYLNGKICDTRNKVVKDDILTVDFSYEEDNSNIVPSKMNLKIIYEDAWLLVVDKPAGIPIHPSRMHYTESLSNGIKFYFDSINLYKKIRPVNRLDLNTSGLVIFAKCEYIQEALIQQMNDKTFKKEYLCLVNGILENKKDTINLPIARKSGSIIERCIDLKNGQPSITHYRVIHEFKKSNDFESVQQYSLVKCTLETGRTHQIRVHMAAIGHPIIGDTLYSSSIACSTKKDSANSDSSNLANTLDRQALHSYHIQCIHPITQKKMNWKAQWEKGKRDVP